MKSTVCTFDANKILSLRATRDTTVCILSTKDRVGEIKYIKDGEVSYKNSIHECNPYGDIHTIWQIFEKCDEWSLRHDGSLHTHKLALDKAKAKDSDNRFFTVVEIVSGEKSYTNNTNHMVDTPIGRIHKSYLKCIYDSSEGINGEPSFGWSSPRNIVGKAVEVENFCHYAHNNKLPLFISMVSNNNAHNNSTRHIPWIADTKHTDQEIYQMLDLTGEEIKVIDEVRKIVNE